MAWNKNYIIIKKPATSEFGEIIKHLGLADLSAAGEFPLLETNKSDDFFIGTYNEVLLIVHPDLPFDFFTESTSETEKKFLEMFPASDIAVLVENSTVDSFGYAVIQNGVKVRMKEGGDGEIYTDIGELLPEEKEILAGKVFEEDELQSMRNDEGMTDDEITERVKFEASWRVPAAVAKSYLGISIDELADSNFRLTKFE
jgi:hypothetical protein